VGGATEITISGSVTTLNPTINASTAILVGAGVLRRRATGRWGTRATRSSWRVRTRRSGRRGRLRRRASSR
jgi:hypothetical protein